MTDRFFETDEPLMRSVLEWAFERIVNGQDPHAGAKSVEVLEAELGGSISAGGIGGVEALRRFTDTVVPATRALGHHMNLAYVPSAPTPASLTFDLAVSAAEIFAGTWEAGAGAIHAENQALRWLAELAGFPSSAGGTFVQGGTVGNLSALAAARERARSEFGVTTARWAIAATNEAHSSIRSAARVLDVEIVGVDGDARGRMTGSALAAALDVRPDVTVFAVVATGGTTNAGIIDDLAGIAAVCHERRLWMHVDGAYGLAALAAPSVRCRFVGIEQADSFVVDPHKWLFAPYDCCALVYKDPGWAHAAHAQYAEYLEQVDRTEWNPSDYAVQLTRRARGLPFWFSLATYGTDRYGEAVERGLRTAHEIAGGIRASEHLELVLEPDLSVVLFRRIGWTTDQMLEWSSQGRVAGSILVLPTRWQGESVFRICIVSPDTRAADVLDALATMH
jgi:glutamate/tyrosine decarboxylase-like PLP-dependent enzyme